MEGSKMETRTFMTEFAGHEVLNIASTEDTKYPTTLGIGKKKAQMILANIEAIKAFVSGQSPNTSVEDTTKAIIPEF